jgi:hypothetical protein
VVTLTSRQGWAAPRRGGQDQLSGA